GGVEQGLRRAAQAAAGVDHHALAVGQQHAALRAVERRGELLQLVLACAQQLLVARQAGVHAAARDGVETHRLARLAPRRRAAHPRLDDGLVDQAGRAFAFVEESLPRQRRALLGGLEEQGAQRVGHGGASLRTASQYPPRGAIGLAGNPCATAPPVPPWNKSRPGIPGGAARAGAEEHGRLPSRGGPGGQAWLRARPSRGDSTEERAMSTLWRTLAGACTAATLALALGAPGASAQTGAAPQGAAAHA